MLEQYLAPLPTMPLLGPEQLTALAGATNLNAPNRLTSPFDDMRGVTYVTYSDAQAIRERRAVAANYVWEEQAMLTTPLDDWHGAEIERRVVADSSEDHIRASVEGGLRRRHTELLAANDPSRVAGQSFNDNMAHAALTEITTDLQAAERSIPDIADARTRAESLLVVRQLVSGVAGRLSVDQVGWEVEHGLGGPVVNALSALPEPARYAASKSVLKSVRSVFKANGNQPLSPEQLAEGVGLPRQAAAVMLSNLVSNRLLIRDIDNNTLAPTIAVRLTRLGLFGRALIDAFRETGGAVRRALNGEDEVWPHET